MLDRRGGLKIFQGDFSGLPGSLHGEIEHGPQSDVAMSFRIRV
jgi:hypothetical protein